MTAPAPLGAPWLQRAYHELRRHRHLIIHGNVDDLVRWRSVYDSFTVVATEFLRVAGFAAIAHFNLADGLTYPDDRSRAELSRIGRRPDADRADPAPVPPTTSPGSRRDLMHRSLAERDDAVRAASSASPRTPIDVLAALSPMLCQTELPCAVLIDSPDLLVGPAGQVTEQFPAQVARVRRMVEAATTPPNDRGLRNTLIFVVKELASVPVWLRESPHLATVLAGPPGQAERAAILEESLPNFYQADGLSDGERRTAITALTNLTDGMTVLDLRSLATTSELARIPASEGRRLVARHRFGLRDDPWEQMDVDRIRNARERLRRRVKGQDEAVRAVSDVLVNARVGVDFISEGTDSNSRPKGVFFFVGPTGTGKTELAKAIAELVFDDEQALRRFDMSEFGQEHSSERLTGAPPGYIGHEQGGVLTNWVIERPFSVLLFDEIEKAHPKVYDKFLQIIDDGRLTDGQGRTAYFSHSIVIFTSNIGARHLPEIPGTPSYEQVKELFLRKVAEFFQNELGRPELYGRLGGGVVAFDILRPEVIDEIVLRFLNQLVASARARGYELVLDRKAIQDAVAAELIGPGARYGAREIRSPLLERWVQVPLNRWILEQAPSPGTRIWVHRTTDSPPFAVDVFPTSTAGAS